MESSVWKCTMIIHTILILVGNTTLWTVVTATSEQMLAAGGMPDNVCQTRACNVTASLIMYDMDNSTKPCDNFYKFSCGGFFKNITLPAAIPELNHFWMVNKNIMRQLRRVIEKPSAPNEPEYIRIVKDFYKSCMNEVVLEQQQVEPLKKKLKEIGGWPVLEGQMWNETKFNWIDSMIKFKQIGLPNVCLFQFFIAPDMRNNTKRVLMLDELELVLPREEYMAGRNHTRVKAYYDLMTDIAVMLGASRENATEELNESLKFEMALAKITLPIAETRNKTQFYNPMTLLELSTKYPSIQWKQYLNKFLEPHFIVDDTEIVIVTVPKFISELIKLIEATPKRVQANYLSWRMALSLSPFLHKALLKKLIESGVDDQPSFVPRWCRCIDGIRAFHGTQTLYIQEYFNEDAKNEAVEMLTNIKDQINEVLTTVDWMDAKTKQNAIDKVAAMSTHVGYPEEFLNGTLLEELYDGLKIADDNYMENVLQTIKFFVNMRHSSLRQPTNRNDWKQHNPITNVNGYYNPTGNSLVIPAGILRDIFFSVDRPKYINYGTIGTIMGHELSHAFDDQQRQFDKNGNLNDWWTQNSDSKYRLKAQCIIDQFNNFTNEMSGEKVNGHNTQGENIADTIGVRIAYMAYRKWLEKNQEEPALPGIPYNSKQMYWISAANIWCSKCSPEQTHKLIAYDPHSPDEFRILGMFRNSPEFAADFQCPIGSKMNPVDKCTFW